MPTEYTHGWPVLKPERTATIINALPDPHILEIVASNVTIYPGGGSPAHMLRQAATLMREAIAAIEQLH